MTNELVDQRDFGQAVLTRPFAVYDALREQAPVFRSEELDLVLVTRHDDVVAVLLDPETYSSGYFAKRTSGSMHGPAVTAVLTSGWPASDALTHVDGARHEFHAGLARPFVAPRTVRSLRSNVEAIVAEFVAKIPDRPVVDLVADFAEDVAISVMCEFVGVPRADRAIWARGADAELALLGGVLSEVDALRYARDYVRMQNRIAELLDERAARPTGDLLSVVATARPPEGLAELTMGEKIRIVQNTVVAGNETTRGLIASAVLRICREPGLEARVRTDDASIEALVEETLRIEPPAMLIFRVATRDHELNGTPVRAGETVAVVLASANFDASVFVDPHTFDVDRANARRHLTFGHGSHHCLGAPLARMEAAIAIRALLAAFDRIELAPGAEPRHFPAFMIRNLVALDLCLHRRAAA